MINLILKLAEMGYREITATPDLFAIKNLETGVVARFKDWQVRWEGLSDEEVIDIIEDTLYEREEKKREKFRRLGRI